MLGGETLAGIIQEAAVMVCIAVIGSAMWAVWMIKREMRRRWR